METIFLDTAIYWTHCILNIYIVLLFQVLQICLPNVQKFWNLDPNKIAITQEDDHLAKKNALKLIKE